MHRYLITFYSFTLLGEIIIIHLVMVMKKKKLSNTRNFHLMYKYKRTNHTNVQATDLSILDHYNLQYY